MTSTRRSLVQRSSWLAVLLAAAATSAVACGGDTESDDEGSGGRTGEDSPSSAAADGKEESCGAFCASIEACGQVAAEVDCSSVCTENTLVSRGGQEVLAACIAEAGCDTTDPLALADCLEDGLEDLPLTEVAEQFCNETAPAISECLGTPAAEGATADCLETIPLLSDDLLGELSECVEDGCAGADTCLGLTFVTAIGYENLEALGDLGFGDALGGLVPGFGGGTEPGMGGAQN